MTTTVDTLDPRSGLPMASGSSGCSLAVVARAKRVLALSGCLIKSGTKAKSASLL